MARQAPTNHLRAWRQFRGLTQQELANRTNTTKTTISRLENEKRTVNVDWLTRIGAVLNVPPHQLLQPLPQKGKAGGDTAPAPARMVPLIDSVAAGAWSDVTDPYPKGHAEEYIAVMGRVGPRAFALRIDGDSMLPEFSDGEIIVVDPDVPPLPGRLVVAKVESEGKATFKRYRVRGRDAKGRDIIDLVPSNPDWPTLTIDARNPGRIVGVVIEHHRRLV